MTFHPPASGASAFMTPGPTAITDSFGIASVDADANGVAGIYDVVATANGVPPVALKLTNTAPPSAAAQIVVPLLSSPQARQILHDFAPLRVQVVDSSSAPVSGATVTFTTVPDAATGASAQLSAATAITDGTGHAEIDATANAFVGLALGEVTVQNNAAVYPASISLRNYAPLPSAMSLVWGSPSRRRS